MEPVDTEERTAFTAAAENWMVRGGGVDIEIVPQGTLGTQEMILNIGPQHPSTGFGACAPDGVPGAFAFGAGHGAASLLPAHSAVP
jgi:hypothetical protein